MHWFSFFIRVRSISKMHISYRVKIHMFLLIPLVCACRTIVPDRRLLAEHPYVYKKRHESYWPESDMRMASALLDSRESTMGDHCKTYKLEEEKKIDAINNFKTSKLRYPSHLTQKEHKRATSIHQNGTLGGETSRSK